MIAGTHLVKTVIDTQLDAVVCEAFYLTGEVQWSRFLHHRLHIADFNSIKNPDGLLELIHQEAVNCYVTEQKRRLQIGEPPLP